MSDRQLKLDDQLCFALYAATNAITRAYKPRLELIGLTYPQYLVMMTLWQHGALNIRQIGKRLKLPANGITPMLDRLEEAGFITRMRDRRDRRIVNIELTPRGAELEKQAANIQLAVVCETQMQEGALNSLRSELQALTEKLETEGETTD